MSGLKKLEGEITKPYKKRRRSMTTTIRAAALVGVFFITILVMGTGMPAHAITFGPNCGSGNCFGSIYTLTTSLSSSTATTQTYNASLSINTAGYNGSGTGLDAASVKIVADSNFVSVANGGMASTFGNPVATGINANGCAGGGGGFVCTSSSNTGGVTVPNGTYTFNFLTTIKTGTLLAEDQWSVKALYVDSAGKQAGITSVSGGGAVPLPATSLLFGLGFALFVTWHQCSRRMNASME
jgi:hypothetical protein